MKFTTFYPEKDLQDIIEQKLRQCVRFYKEENIKQFVYYFGDVGVYMTLYYEVYGKYSYTDNRVIGDLWGLCLDYYQSAVCRVEGLKDGRR